MSTQKNFCDLHTKDVWIIEKAEYSVLVKAQNDVHGV